MSRRDEQLKRLADAFKAALERDHGLQCGETCWFLNARLHYGEPDVFVDRGKILERQDYKYKVKSVLHASGETYLIAQYLVFRTPWQARNVLIGMCQDAAKRDEETNFRRPEIG